MPTNNSYQALFVTISAPDDVRASWTKEYLSHLKRNCIWYGIKHENDGVSKKLHIHAINVFEIQDSEYRIDAGGKTCDNWRTAIVTGCPTIKQYIKDKEIPRNNIKYLVHVIRARSEVMITYMQKTGDLLYHDLPQDRMEIQPYFADLQGEKSKTPQYDTWETMYLEELRTMPATLESVKHFFTYHNHVTRDLCVQDNELKANGRNKQLMLHLNHKEMSIHEQPAILKYQKYTTAQIDIQKQFQEDVDKYRMCRRCDDELVSDRAPNCIYCDKCRK